MDSFDWAELLNDVNEYGHGAVKFELQKEFRSVELKVDTVIIDETNNSVTVTMLEVD